MARKYKTITTQVLFTCIKCKLFTYSYCAFMSLWSNLPFAFESHKVNLKLLEAVQSTNNENMRNIELTHWFSSEDLRF